MFRRAASLLLCFLVLLFTALIGRNSHAQQKPTANADPPANSAQTRIISYSADFLSGNFDAAQDYFHDVIRSGKRIRIYKTPFSFLFNSINASYFLNHLTFNVYAGNSEETPLEYNLIPIVKGEHNPYRKYTVTLSGRSDGSAMYGTVSDFKANYDSGWKGLTATLEVTGGTGIFKGATGTVKVTGETVIDSKTKRYNLVGHASGTITVAAAQWRPDKRIVVNIYRQKLIAYEDNKIIYEFNCVTGRTGKDTELGLYKIIRKVKDYHSKKYDAPMPYASFFSSDGKAIHGSSWVMLRSYVQYVGAGIFGSHGCVGLSENDAKAIFEWAAVGTSVSVVEK